MQALISCASCVIFCLDRKQCSQTTVRSSVVSITNPSGCLGCNLFTDRVELTLQRVDLSARFMVATCLFSPTAKPTDSFEFPSPSYFPPFTSLHENFKYDFVTRPYWSNQVNITPKPLTQIFPLGSSTVSLNLLPLAHLCPRLAQIQRPCQTWNTRSSLAAATTCHCSFSFSR